MSDFKTPSADEVMDAVTADNNQQLASWLQQGMSVNAMVNSDLLLAVVVENGAFKCLNLLLQEGVNTDNHQNGLDFPPLYCAVQSNNPNMVHALLENGAESKSDTPDENYLHIAAYPYGKADKSIEIFDRILAGGADINAKNGNGKLPLNLARGNYPYASMMTYRYDLDMEISSRKIDKEGLHQTRKKPGLEAEYHQSWLEMPVTWAWMGRIVPQLEKKDECITREELEQSPKNMVWAMLGDNLPLLDAHLKQQGERGIGLADFVDTQGKATPTLETACEMWAERRLMQQEWVKELKPQELQVLYKAMPEEARGRIPNYHQMMQTLRNNTQSQTGVGR